ncbi:MAG: sensor histidine kinase [Bacteroidales bacterium]|nr:sensor histidine kinase [Bacteroidales bacterium]
MEDIKQVGFTVDAGLINRLGIELVGKAETAVSELIKNAYDADATEVKVKFIDSDEVGGTLIISDNGLGMTEEQLINGFMRISSTDKIRNPKSIKFKRTRAGRKGIGRFATQSLGKKLTIITQTKESQDAIQITIDWDEYLLGTDLNSVTFPISITPKIIECGTILKMEGLRQRWKEHQIKRISKYVSSLFQPNYLSERSKEIKIATQEEQSFDVSFFKITNNNVQLIESQNNSIFDLALCSVEGYVNKDNGIIEVKGINIKSDSVLDELINVRSKQYDKYTKLENVRYKLYYFIFQKDIYYKKISKTKLSEIEYLARNGENVKVYHNGFRVLPYGEPNTDWINLNQRYSNASGSGIVNIPYRVNNFFGFVEIIDPDNNFEETSSREGFVENEEFKQLVDFMNQSLEYARRIIGERIYHLKYPNNKTVIQPIDKDDITEPKEEQQKSDQELVNTLKDSFTKEINQNQNYTEEEKKDKQKQTDQAIAVITQRLEEIGMLRVLAGLGLTIGAFVHEVKQFKSKIPGLIAKLKRKDNSFDETLLKLERRSDELFRYTQYFNTTISQNTNRKKEPVDILEVLDDFQDIISDDLDINNIEFNLSINYYDAITLPMHRSEWTSILYNLFTNAKKAIIKKSVAGKILIEVNKKGRMISIKFNDNGIGIEADKKDRVFNAFYSTSVPASFDAPKEEQLVGTGLGLKIVKDIILSYNGDIKVVEPNQGYATCFEILIPHK